MPRSGCLHIATALAIARVDGISSVLLVASRYANHALPLWTLPGGRQQPGELLAGTAIRELREETALNATAGELAYLSESYDGETHVLNATFCVNLTDARAPRRPESGDHVVDAAWVPIEQLASRIAVAIVRDPLLAYVRGNLTRRYAGYREAGVTIRWPEEEL